jgi:protease I
MTSISPKEQDQTNKQSFPASDPPSWNMGSEREVQERKQRQAQDDKVGDTDLMSAPEWDLSGKRIAILAADGFEQSELLDPRQALEQAGAETHVVSLASGSIRSWHQKNWGEQVAVNIILQDAKAENFDALLLPGGTMNPDRLRTQPEAVQFVRRFAEQGKPIAAICHGPWLLVEAGLTQGARLTSWPSLRTDIENAGGEWVDEAVVSDHGLITSRKPDDLPAFNAELLKALSAETAPRLKIGATNIS